MTVSPSPHVVAVLDELRWLVNLNSDSNIERWERIEATLRAWGAAAEREHAELAALMMDRSAPYG